MKRIYKYKLARLDSQSILLPVGAEILGAAFQGAQLVLWAAIDTEEKRFDYRQIFIFATGQDMKERIADLKLIERVHLKEYVFHVFTRP